MDRQLVFISNPHDVDAAVRKSRIFEPFASFFGVVAAIEPLSDDNRVAHVSLRYWGQSRATVTVPMRSFDTDTGSARCVKLRRALNDRRRFFAQPLHKSEATRQPNAYTGVGGLRFVNVR